MERIVFLDRDTVRAEFRTPEFEHEWTDYPMTQPSEVLERLKDATIAITNKVALRKEMLEQLPKLKMIQVAATGTDCVDSAYCREHGITVANVKNYSVHSVPEHVFSLILALRRNIAEYRADVFAGKWQASPIFCLLDYPILDLHSATLGIVGYGTLGKAVAEIARAFGMNVLIGEHKSAETIREGRVSFDELLEKSDIITLHCPLTDETRNIIGAAELKKMKSSAILINCGRGGLVDEKALAEALKNQQIGGAGVDVLTQEPPKDGNPLLEIDQSNLILTPHIAWASVGAVHKLTGMLIDNLEAFVRGEL
jgi:glycerate dehydrogenase